MLGKFLIVLPYNGQYELVYQVFMGGLVHDDETGLVPSPPSPLFIMIAQCQWKGLNCQAVQ